MNRLFFSVDCIIFLFISMIICSNIDGEEIFADSDSNETIQSVGQNSHSAIDYSLNGTDLLDDVSHILFVI